MANEFTSPTAGGIMDERRTVSDRRAHSRSGRRGAEAIVPWYRRRRIWVAIASLVYVGWRRFAGRAGS
jgi:hypothetical protein